eukprot:TRINITY_DN34037_c0_g1_i1.p2 TRINITY_DN34037_c0_g1~~TRINITY_DN34037_c0_g1_i1.p2  ORF type:complete len:145 (+),score=27.17 TRINITY_DN34037_c0_g1_i1:36-470(+)
MLEPIRKWEHLYCAVEGCGYPMTPYPPEGKEVACMACGAEYKLEKELHDKDMVEEVLKAEGAEGLPFSINDPNVRMGVDWLQRIAEGAKATESKTIMDTIMEYCGNCKARTKCTYYSKQTRGADEGQTQFYTCTKCEDTWMAHS